MSEVHNTATVPHSTEAKDIATSVHKNALSVWRGHKEKKSVSFAEAAPAASSQSALRFSYSCASSLLRTGSVPDVVGPAPTFSSTSQNVSTAVDAVCASSIRFLTPQPFRKGSFSKPKMTNSQANFHRQTPSTGKPNASRQTYSPSDGLAVKGPGRRKEQVVQSEKDINLVGLPKHASKITYFSFYIHCDSSPSCVLSILLLVKSLSISLEDLQASPTLHRSTLSCRLAISNSKRFRSTNHRRATRCRESGTLSYCRGLQSKHKSHKVKQIAPAHDANGADSDLQSHGATAGLLTFSGPSPPYIKSTRQKGNADEGVQATHCHFKHKRHTDDGSWSRGSFEKDDLNTQTSLHTYKTCYYHSPLKEDTVDGAAKNLSLQEALELFRPDFIRRSQNRLQQLELRTRTRTRTRTSPSSAHRDSSPGSLHGLGEDPGKHTRNCTTPDPLSDNLFKPRERTISGREMQLRSRRIYNTLPEVTKRRQEEKRRAVSQTNRLRAEVYKKKLLDQVLQR